jgi:hypothetical protein
MFRSALLSLLALSSAFAGTGRAQTFTGTVTDKASGGVVPGATVSIKVIYYVGNGTQQVNLDPVTTDGTGKYSTTATPPDGATKCDAYVSVTSTTKAGRATNLGQKVTGTITTDVTLTGPGGNSPVKRTGNAPGKGSPAAPSRRPARVAE